MQHEHLKFYSHSSLNTTSSRVGGGGLALGTGSSLVPTLNTAASDNSSYDQTQRKLQKTARSGIEKHVEIIEYLKHLPASYRVTFIDVQRDLDIDLHEDIQVLGMMKSNARVDTDVDSDGNVSFGYRSKYSINNKIELLQIIAKNRNGIVLQDIKDCYADIEIDSSSLIIGGDIIATRNKELKSLVLYPRGEPYYSQLSGTVTAIPGKPSIHTSSALEAEIRRGEAIKVGTDWYRVSSAITGQQTQRSVAPPSVTLDKDLSDRNLYCAPFTGEALPLDGDFDGEEQFKGPALRHGCTTDIKDIWHQTADSLKRFEGDGVALYKELVSLRLLDPHSLNNANPAGQTRAGIRALAKKKKIRKVRQSSSNNSSGHGVNAHLKGSELEQILKETREKLDKERT